MVVILARSIPYGTNCYASACLWSKYESVKKHHYNFVTVCANERDSLLNKFENVNDAVVWAMSLHTDATILITSNRVQKALESRITGLPDPGGLSNEHSLAVKRVIWLVGKCHPFKVNFHLLKWEKRKLADPWIMRALSLRNKEWFGKESAISIDNRQTHIDRVWSEVRSMLREDTIGDKSMLKRLEDARECLDDLRTEHDAANHTKSEATAPTTPSTSTHAKPGRSRNVRRAQAKRSTGHPGPHSNASTSTTTPSTRVEESEHEIERRRTTDMELEERLKKTLEQAVIARGTKRQTPPVPDYPPEKRRKISGTHWVRLESTVGGRSNWSAPEGLNDGHFRRS